MSESRIQIDARGLECPKPVLLVRQAILEGRPGHIEVRVDTKSARSNVARFAGTEGYSCAIAEQADGSALLTLAAAAPTTQETGAADSPATGSSPIPAEAGAAAGVGAGGRVRTVFIAGDVVGSPPQAVGVPPEAAGVPPEAASTRDQTLGRVLMRALLFTLAESDSPPERIVLMNAGVYLACEPSEHLVNLRRLAGRGVQVFACGTCLQHYGLSDALAVGRVSNMYEIASILMEGGVLSV